MMHKQNISIRLSNPHKGNISMGLSARILKQAEIEIDIWKNL